MNVESPSTSLLQQLDLDAVAHWVARQRWYASKSRAIAGLEIEEAFVVADSPPLLVTLAHTRFATGSHELYQLPLRFLTPAQLGEREVISGSLDWLAVDAVADPELARDLLRCIDEERRIDTDTGVARFCHVAGAGRLQTDGTARPIGVEQSNSSIVFGESTVLKLFRRLEPGINPELEMLRFLTEHGYANIAPLHGWYGYESRAVSATLGIAQLFLAGAVGGWELALREIAADPDAFLAQVGALGTTTAELHNALASDASDPSFSPEEPSTEALALLVATIDEDIERVFTRLPDDERVAGIAGRGQDVREQIAHRAQLGIGGRSIRTHGDYHLGQTLRRGRDWVIIDFEGEPARPLFERRQKHSPLRDVAGMLRSFAYATSAASIQHGQGAPERFEQRARDIFLEHYLQTIDPGLLPGGDAGVRNLLSIFELEKAIYELQYELDNRPDWLPIPVAGITRILDAD